jgi:hypothetical protein
MFINYLCDVFPVMPKIVEVANADCGDGAYLCKAFSVLSKKRATAMTAVFNSSKIVVLLLSL